MNILKIKLIVFSTLLIFCALIFSTAASGQITETNDGAQLKSLGKSWLSQLSLHGSTGTVFGGIRGQYVNGAPEVSLFNNSWAPTLTARKGNVLMGSNFNVSSGGWTWVAQNWKHEGTAERINDGYVAAMVFDDESNIRFYTAGDGDAADPVNNTPADPVNGSHKMFISNDGRVGIGYHANNMVKDKNGNQIFEYKLFVEKGIMAEKVKCSIDKSDDWADYVFEEDYEMMDIDELEDYVTENKHLPNVPSAEEMVENGLDVAKMDAKLLEKIEEAYLYIIDMNKEMEAMGEKVDALATENQSLKTSLQSISTSGK